MSVEILPAAVHLYKKSH